MSNCFAADLEKDLERKFGKKIAGDDPDLILLSQIADLSWPMATAGIRESERSTLRANLRRIKDLLEDI